MEKQGSADKNYKKKKKAKGGKDIKGGCKWINEIGEKKPKRGGAGGVGKSRNEERMVMRRRKEERNDLSSCGEGR